MLRALRLVTAGPRTAWVDLLHAIEGVLTPGLPALQLVAPPVLGLLAAWYGYVPVHASLRVAAAAILGEGSLAATIVPYVIEALVGVPLLRAAGSGSLRWWWWRRFTFGPAVILALSPFVAVVGDYFELGAAAVTAFLPDPWLALQSDDLFLLIERLDRAEITVPGGRLAAGAVATVSLLASVCLAGWTYLAGALWGDLMARRGRPAREKSRGGAAPPSPVS